MAAPPPEGEVVMLFSGYKDMPEVRADLAAEVARLGGRVVPGVTWRDEITHVVAATFGDYKETVLGALAAGRWVVTRRFVDRSAAAGAWKDPRAFVAHDSILESRERWGREGALFRGVRAVIVMTNRQRREVYGRLVRAGGGEVLEDWGLVELAENQPGPEDVSLVVADCDLLGREDSRHEQFLDWLLVARECGACPPVVYFHLVFEMILQAKTIEPETFSIFSPLVQVVTVRCSSHSPTV